MVAKWGSLVGDDLVSRRITDKGTAAVDLTLSLFSPPGKSAAKRRKSYPLGPARVNAKTAEGESMVLLAVKADGGPVDRRFWPSVALAGVAN